MGKTIQKIKRVLTWGSVSVLSVGTALATPAIANDTLRGLPAVFNDLGGFLTNLAPGVGTIILIVGLFTAIGGMIGAVVGKIGSKVK